VGSQHGENYRNRSRDEQLGGRDAGRRATRHHPQCRRDDDGRREGVPVVRGVHQGRPADRGRAGPPSSDLEPGRYGHRVQAEDGHRLQVQTARQGVHSAAALRVLAPEGQAGRRGVPRGEGREGRHHRPRLLQRQPAPGDEGRRRDRRSRCRPDHQRTDRRVARLRARQGGQESEDPRLRSRGRHARRDDHGLRGRRLRGRLDERRHPARRHRHGRGDDRVGRRGVPEGVRRRHPQGQDGDAAGS